MIPAHVLLVRNGKRCCSFPCRVLNQLDVSEYDPDPAQCLLDRIHIYRLADEPSDDAESGIRDRCKALLLGDLDDMSYLACQDVRGLGDDFKNERVVRLR